MGKKFAEYSKLDLSEVNGKVLKKWDENQVFAKSMTHLDIYYLTIYNLRLKILLIGIWYVKSYLLHFKGANLQKT